VGLVLLAQPMVPAAAEVALEIRSASAHLVQPVLPACRSLEAMAVIAPDLARVVLVD
jgi:hypothetical protein